MRYGTTLGRSVLLTMGLLAATLAQAEEGRIPIFEPGILPAVSGRYILTRDVVGTTSASTIQIIGTGVEKMEIDLNGYVLQATFGAGGGGDFPVLAAQDLAELVVRGGGIVGDSNRSGISCLRCDKVRVEDVSVRDVISGIWMTHPGNFEIRRNVVDNASNYGIRISGDDVSPAPASGTIADNVIENVDMHGIWVAPTAGLNGVTLSGNRIRNAGLANGSNKDGIRIESLGPVQVLRNTVTEVRGSGIHAIVEGGAIEGNIIERADLDGMFVTSSPGTRSSCRIWSNVLLDSGDSGLHLETDGNQINDNVLNGNTDHGLLFDSTADGNNYQGNIIVGNGMTCITDNGTGNTALAANVLIGSPGGCP